MTVLVVTEESITEKFLSSSPEDILDSGNAGIFGKSMLRLDFEVQDDAAYQLNSEVYAKAREWKVAIEAHKRKLTRPHKAKIDEITATLKPVLAAVEKVIDEANCRAGAYLVLLEERRRKQEDDLKEIATLFGSVEAPEVDLVQPCSPQTVLVTKRVKKFRITDLSKVPSRYLTISTEMVEQDISLGVAEIPGIEIYEETTSSLRRT